MLYNLYSILWYVNCDAFLEAKWVMTIKDLVKNTAGIVVSRRACPTLKHGYSKFKTKACCALRVFRECLRIPPWLMFMPSIGGQSSLLSQTQDLARADQKSWSMWPWACSASSQSYNASPRTKPPGKKASCFPKMPTLPQSCSNHSPGKTLERWASGPLCFYVCLVF